MGCSASRMERREGEAPLGGALPLRRRIEEIKRRRHGRWRKDSIVSTTELLGPHEELCEDSVDPSAFPPQAESHGGVQVEKKNDDHEEEEAAAVGEQEVKAVLAEEKKEEEKSGEERAEEEEKRGEAATATAKATATATAVAAAAEEEELPGSPSFRFYFVPKDLDDDGSVKASWLKNNNEVNAEDKEKENLHASEDPKGNSQFSGNNSGHSTESFSSNEDVSLAKSSQKERGKKQRRLTTVPSRVYKMLKFRSCYSHINAADAAAVTAHQHRRAASINAV